MKLIIAGSRDLQLTLTQLDDIMTELKVPTELVTEVVSGGASGIDAIGELWAECRPDPLKMIRFEADWDTHGKAAGPIRNKQMGLYADAALIITKKGWTPGSKNMHDIMRRLKKKVWVKEV